MDSQTFKSDNPSHIPGVFPKSAGRHEAHLPSLLTDLKDQEFVMTALFWAATTGQASLVRTIFHHGVGVAIMTSSPIPDPFFTLRHGRSILFQVPGPLDDDWLVDFVLRERTALALHEGYGEPSLKTGTANWTTVLHHAVGQNDLLLLESALVGGVDIEQRDYLGRTALYIAALKADKVATGVLIARAAEVDVMDRFSRTPLQEARRIFGQSGSRAVIWLLLQNGDLQFKDEQGVPLLHLAIQYKHIGLVRTLLDKYREEEEEGAVVNTRGPHGSTVLHEAASAGFVNAIWLLDRLLARGCSGENGIGIGTSDSRDGR
ncbi:hypothetical protein Q9L58_001175 [Maublancomyces gigas]|uniref:Uncharacterized protein n=1 Tax=Discina gigas TaxID=1032678 RepID=A0ABR3GVH6_9PEZI